MKLIYEIMKKRGDTNVRCISPSGDCSQAQMAKSGPRKSDAELCSAICTPHAYLLFLKMKHHLKASPSRLCNFYEKKNVGHPRSPAEVR